MGKSKEQLEAELRGWQYVYESAKKKGNQQAMDNAHAAANQIRREMGSSKSTSQAEAELNGWGYVYNAAKRRGDTAGMDEAHQKANAIRAEQGWRYEPETGKTKARVIGPLERTVNSKTVMDNAKIWDPKKVTQYRPQTVRRVTAPASTYLTGAGNTPSSSPAAAAMQPKNAQARLMELARSAAQTRDGADRWTPEAIAKGFGYGAERTLSGAAGALEDAARFVSGYGNKLLSGITSLGGLVDNPVSDYLARTAENTLSNSFTDRWRADIEERYQPDEFSQKIGDIGEAAGAMLPTIAAGLASGGLSAGTAIGKGAAMTAQAARAADQIQRGVSLSAMLPTVMGSSTRQAMQEGADINKALAYGALSGALETGTESMFAGLPGIKSGIASDILRKATQNPIVNRVADTLGEGVEEVVSGILTPYLQRMTYNEQAEIASSDDLLNQFISGVLVSGLMQGAAGIAGRVTQTRENTGLDTATLGENSRKNYTYQKNRDGGQTPDFDAQWDYYNRLGNAGIPQDQVESYPTRTPIGQAEAYAAHAAGLNDYRARAVQDAQDILDGRTMQDSAIDRALDVSESRKMLETAMGKTLPDSYAKARKMVWDWQAEQAKKSAPIGTQYKFADHPIPTREQLEAKPDMRVVDIRDEAARSFDRTSQTGREMISKPYQNADTGEYVFINQRAIKHTLNNGTRTHRSLAAHLPELIENAVLTHGESSYRADDHTTGVFTLFSAAQTDTGIVPVKLKVKEYELAGQTIPENVQGFLTEHPSDAYAMTYDGKLLVVEEIEPDGSTTTRSGTGPEAVSDPSGSTISVAELLGLVNDEGARKYIPAAEPSAPRAPGLVRNAYAASVDQGTADAMDRIAKKAGITVEIADDVPAAGEYRDGVIRINANAQNPVRQVFVHELTHHLERSGDYQALSDLLRKHYEADGVDFSAYLRDIQDQYAANGIELDEAGAMKEAIAEISETVLFTDERSVQRLARENRSLVQKIRDWLHEMRVKLRGTQEEKFVLEAEKMYQKVLDSTKGQKKNAPGETQYSLNPDFAQELDYWVERPWRNVPLFVGRTSDALQSIGVKDNGIYWDTKKVRKIMDKHDGMTIDVIKQVPQILENPVIVMQSKQADSRITMFGEVVDANGKPVLAVLELQPSDKNGALQMDTIKLASAYGKDRVQGFLNSSDILYLDPDKKRTDTWLKSTRLQLPFAPTKYGPIQSIAYPDAERNTQKSLDGNFFDRLERSGQKDVADRLRRAFKQYGTYARGEYPARDVQIPKQMNDETRVRRFPRTAAEASVLTDEQAGAIGKAVAEGRFNYDPIPDKAARSHAETVLARGERYAQDAWDRVVNNNRPASKNDIAVGEYLLKQAAEAGDTQRVVELAAQIAAEGTRAGQIVQSMRLIKQLGGPGQAVALDATIKKLQGELDRGKSGVFLKVPDGLREDLVRAKGEAQVGKALDAIYQNLADQMPSRWQDKWNAWRYLSMLGNPRTHIRNLAGNAVFAPVVGVKNAVGSLLESGVHHAQRLAGREGIARTKTIRGTLPLTGGKARTFAIDDFSKVQDIIKGGGKMNPSDAIRDKQVVFTSKYRPVRYALKPLESLCKLNFNALEAEDGLFLKHHYVRSMVQYMQANKIDLDAFDPDNHLPDQRTLQKARDYAIREAQKATYRDFSKAAQAISQLSRRAGGGVNILLEGVLPFKKTPINVLKRGIEYSPAGLLDAITRGAAKLKKGEIGANEFIDRLSAGMTGTGISVLGMLLYKNGMLVGGPGDDKEAEFRDSLGAQSYAITWDGKSYTIDWMAPGAMPLFVGAEMERLSEQFEGLSGRVVWDAVLNLAEPMTKMSMLDGLNSTIASVRYGDDPLSDMAANTVISYIGQAVPTLLGQIARTVDDTARTTYIDKNGGIPDAVQRAIQKNQNKIPLLSKNSIAYRDVFGRAETDKSPISRALQNFLSPGYYGEEKIGKMEEELLRLYQETGESGVLPSMPAKSFNVNGARKDLTAAEYERFSYSRGAVLYGALSKMTGQPAYTAMDDTDKAGAVTDMISLANALAKTEVSDYAPGGWQADAQQAAGQDISMPDFVLLRQQTRGLQSLKYAGGDKQGETIPNSKSLLVMQAVNRYPGLTQRQRQFLYAANDVGKKVIGYNPAKVDEEVQKMRREAE